MMMRTSVAALWLYVLSFADAQDEVGPVVNLQRCVAPDEFGGDFDIDLFPYKFEPRLYRGPADFFPGQYALDESTDLLEITYHKTYKIIKNHFQNTSYLLYQCGTEPPADELAKHNLSLPIPFTGGIGITETPQIPPLELLGLRQEIVAYVGDPQYISSPCLVKRRDELGTLEVYFDKNDPWNRTRQLELKDDFFTKHPEGIILEGPYGHPEDYRSIAIAASSERTNVATFDWIGLYAALFNLEEEANRIASETLDRYECSISNAAYLSEDLPPEQQVKVLWASWIEGYNWSVAECTTWDETYYCEYAAHCGANIIKRPEEYGYAPDSLGGNFWYINDDEVLELGRDADIWIYPSKYWDSMYAEKKHVIDQFKAFQNKQVYDIQGQGEFGWFEQRFAEYDVVALDFCALVGNLNPNGPQHRIKWFRNMFTQDMGSPGECTSELDAPYVPNGANCDPIVSASGAASSGAKTWPSLISSFLSLVIGLVGAL